MKAYPLSDYLHRHPGDTAWIFGKGPSIDGFDFATAGPVRAAINDVIGLVPDCLYGFACDSVRDWADLYQPQHTLFTPRRTVDDEFLRPILPDCDVVIFDDTHGTDANFLEPRDPERLAHQLQIRSGTLGSALQILFIMGIRKIIAVGIDGGQAHGQRTKWRTRLRNEHYKDYNRIRAEFIAGAQLLGIELEFYKHGAPNTDGTMKVLITRNTFVRGEYYAEGITTHLAERDARDLVHCAKARILPDSPEIPETRARAKKRTKTTKKKATKA